MKVVLYIRVSTDEQAKEGYSLKAQEAILRREAERLEMEIVFTYLDEGLSAKNMKRPALRRMIADFSKGTFEAVLFWRLDRLTRRSKDFHDIVEQMSSHNIGMISIAEKIDTTSAIGRFQLELSVSLAQLERETISERVSQVMEERARKGLRNGAPAALGYKLVDKKHVLDEHGAKIVNEIFDLYLAGTGFRAIAHLMLKRPDAADLLNWSGASIRYILQNPIYTGKLRWNYIDSSNKATGNEIITEADHLPIIEKEKFARVQEGIRNRKAGGKRFTSDHVFSSVLRCGKCGARMQGFAYKHNDRIYKTYRCSNKIEKGTCDFPNTRENGVAEAFLSEIDYGHFDFGSVEMPEQKSADHIKEIKTQLEKIDQRKKRWRVAFANDLMTLDELRDHLQSDKDQEDKLNVELRSLGAQANDKWTKAELTELLKDLKRTWSEASDKAKKLFVQELFEYMVIDVAPGEVAGQGRRPKLIIRDFKFKLNTFDK